jgi:hypothetical protein
MDIFEKNMSSPVKLNVFDKIKIGNSEFGRKV